MLKKINLILLSAVSLVYLTSPAQARFLSNDPVGTQEHLQKGNVQGFSRFTYASNNPNKYVDPDGRAELEINGKDQGSVNGQELLDKIAAQPDGSIDSMSLFNHGGVPQLMNLNEGSSLMALGHDVQVSGADNRKIGELGKALSSKVTQNAKIDLKGCQVANGPNSVAASLSNALPNTTVQGYKTDALNLSLRVVGGGVNIGQSSTYKNGVNQGSSVWITTGDPTKLKN